MSKDRLTSGLRDIGAAWAVTDDKTILPDDGFGAKPTYHIHPDASYPHQAQILRCGTQAEVKGYIDARRAAAAATDAEAEDIMQDWYYR